MDESKTILESHPYRPQVWDKKRLACRLRSFVKLMLKFKSEFVVVDSQPD